MFKVPRFEEVIGMSVVVMISFSLVLSLSLQRLWESRGMLLARFLMLGDSMVSPTARAMDSAYMASWDGLGADCFAWASGKPSFRRFGPI
jgi:hypothetical protein